MTLANIVEIFNTCRKKKDRLCKNTIRKVLHEISIKKHISLNKPYLSKEHADLRLSWARKHIEYWDNYWANVIWFDETSFEINKKGQIKLWRQENERLNNDCITQTFKSTRKK